MIPSEGLAHYFSASPAWAPMWVGVLMGAGDTVVLVSSAHQPRLWAASFRVETIAKLIIRPAASADAGFYLLSVVLRTPARVVHICDDCGGGSVFGGGIGIWGSREVGCGRAVRPPTPGCQRRWPRRCGARGVPKLKPRWDLHF